MFIELMIIIIVLSDFLTLVYAKQRLEYNDTSLLAKKAGIKLEGKLNKIMVLGNVVRLLIAIFVLLFWIYSLFYIPFLRLPVILNMITGTISITTLAIIMKQNPDIFATFNKRVWLLRIDAVVSLMIWSPYFLPLLALAFWA